MINWVLVRVEQHTSASPLCRWSIWLVMTIPPGRSHTIRTQSVSARSNQIALPHSRKNPRGTGYCRDDSRWAIIEWKGTRTGCPLAGQPDSANEHTLDSRWTSMCLTFAQDLSTCKHGFITLIDTSPESTSFGPIHQAREDTLRVINILGVTLGQNLMLGSIVLGRARSAWLLLWSSKRRACIPDRDWLETRRECPYSWLLAVITRIGQPSSLGKCTQVSASKGRTKGTGGIQQRSTFCTPARGKRMPYSVLALSRDRFRWSTAQTLWSGQPRPLNRLTIDIFCGHNPKQAINSWPHPDDRMTLG